MKQLQDLLTTLETQRHRMSSVYARALQSRIERAIREDIDFTGTTANSPDNSGLTINGNVAMIDVNGFIAKRTGLPQQLLSYVGVVDLDYVDAQILSANNNSNVSTILFDVNSPGGFAMGNRHTAELIANSPKQTIVYSDILNASAAYLFSSQADSIIISDECEIGCVGTFAAYFNYSQNLKQNGITYTVFKSGDQKDMGDPYAEPLTKEEAATIQNDIDTLGAEFRQYVTEKRNIDTQYLQGLTYRGVEAVKYGFADAIANSKQEVLDALNN